MAEKKAKETEVEETTTAEEVKAEETQTEETATTEESTEAAEESEKTEEKVEEVVAETGEKVEEAPVAEAKEEAKAEKAEKKEAKTEKSEPTKPEPTKSEPTKPAPSVNVNPKLEDFDWSAISKKGEQYTAAEKERLDKVYEETLKSIADHEVLDGKVVAKTKKDLLVNIGYKSEGVIPLSELRYNPDIAVGDELEVYVEKQEDKDGQLILSHKKARALRSWERVNKALDNDEVITGYIKCRTKGGLIADVFGIEAFLPGSQIDVKPIRDYDMYVGKQMEFKVVKINNEFKNVVVSHKALIQEELEQQKKEIISKLEKGQILEGTVKNITSYGVFVDLGGVDGLIHITDLSWGRINHPEEIVTLDEKINVVILDFDDDKKRIALGLKQLTEHPWEKLDTELKVGDNVKGKVVVLADYGAFVEVAPGVEGLIHVSEMSWSQHLRSASDFLKVGDEVEAQVLTLDREERKMSLGIKQLAPDPWTDITTKYPVGSQHTGKVMNFTNFGVFVELEEGVDGLVHISDLSWSKKVKHPAEFCNVGDDMEIVVLDIDVENRKLSLGHKQLEENPWDVFEEIFTIDSVHQGTITEKNDKGGVVSLPYGMEGFAPKKHLNKEDGKQAEVDETLDFKILEFNKDQKKIIVSHSRIFEDVAHEAKVEETKQRRAAAKSTSKAVKKMKDNIEKTTLGDLDALSQLKSQLEESEKKGKKSKDEDAE